MPTETLFDNHNHKDHSLTLSKVQPRQKAVKGMEEPTFIRGRFPEGWHQQHHVKRD